MGSGNARQMPAWCLHNDACPLSVYHVAEAFGVSVRTCNRRLAAAGIGTLADVVGFSRTLRAALRLERDETPLSLIAGEMGFPDAHALRMQLKRRLGLTPTQCRAGEVRLTVMKSLPRLAAR